MQVLRLRQRLHNVGQNTLLGAQDLNTNLSLFPRRKTMGSLSPHLLTLALQ